MANKISIGIHVNNRASAPLNKIHKQVHNFRQTLVRFNRNMFTAGALIGTFGMGFRKAMDLSKVGAQFEFVRERFMNALGPAYWKDLRIASRETIDAMSLMQTAVQGYSAGLSKSEITQAATLAVGAAKIMGEEASTSFKKITKALYSNNVAAFKNYMVNLQTSNQFQILNKVLDSTVKGLGSAGMKFDVFRKMALQKLSMAMTQYLDSNEDSLEILMRTGAAFKSLRQVVGEFVARALAPLAKIVTQRISPIFERLFTILNGTTDQLREAKGGLIDFIQVMGVAGGALTAGLGGFSLLNLFLGTLGISFTSFASVIGLAAIALAAFKGENQGWLEFLGKMGTAMKFVIQAFMSYKDGAITISGEVYERFMMLDEGTRNFILTIGKLAAQTRIFLNGMKDGFMGIVNTISDAISSVKELLGMTGKVNMMSHEKGAGIKTAGMMAGGIMTGLAGLFMAKKVMGGLGSIVTGGFGKRGSFTNPMWVKMANMAGMATAVGSTFGSTLKGVLTAGTLGYAAGTALDKQFGWSDKIANWMVNTFHDTGEKESGLGLINRAKNQKKTTFTGVDDKLKSDFMAQMSDIQKNYRDKEQLLPKHLMRWFMEDKDLNSNEIKAIMKQIARNTEKEQVGGKNIGLDTKRAWK